MVRPAKRSIFRSMGIERRRARRNHDASSPSAFNARNGRTLPVFPSNIVAIRSAVRSAAAINAESSRRMQCLCVRVRAACPNSSAIVLSPKPRSAAALANVRRKSCDLASANPAALNSFAIAFSNSAGGAMLRRGKTHSLALRGKPSNSSSAGLPIGRVERPVLVASRRKHWPSGSISVQRRHVASCRRSPVRADQAQGRGFWAVFASPHCRSEGR
jgi:hypothetical protein